MIKNLKFLGCSIEAVANIGVEYSGQIFTTHVRFQNMKIKDFTHSNWSLRGPAISSGDTCPVSDTRH